MFTKAGWETQAAQMNINPCVLYVYVFILPDLICVSGIAMCNS